MKPARAAYKQQMSPPAPIFHWEFGICSFLSQVRSLRLRWLFVQVAQLEKDKVTWVPQLSLGPLLSLLRSLTEVYISSYYLLTLYWGPSLGSQVQVWLVLSPTSFWS